MAQNLITITEINQGGSVPNLKVISKADIPVLILDGEELKGAKQNRILNASVLVAPHSELIVPVSCTEAGRWSYNSDAFSESGNVLPSSMRLSKMDRVSKNLEDKLGFDANQSIVWDEIQEKQSEHRVSSYSSALSDVFSHLDSDLGEAAKHFALQENQCGIYVEMDGTYAGMDIVSLPSAWQDVHEKIVRSYVMEAINKKHDTVVCDASHYTNLLDKLPDCEYAQHKSVGLGMDIRLRNKELVGAVLEHDDSCVHIAIYPYRNMMRTKFHPPQESSNSFVEVMETYLRNRR